MTNALTIVEDYLNGHLFNFSLADASRFSDKREPLANRIYRVLVQSDLHSGAIGPDIEKMLREKITLSVKESKPITIIVGMGGCKGYKTFNAPSINWAEFFHLKFLFDKLNVISQIFPPGVFIEFSPDDLGAQFINFYKQEWIDIYRHEFGDLISYFNTNAPENFSFSLRTASEWYSMEEITKAKDEELKKIMADPKQVEEIQRVWTKRAMNNIYTEEMNLNEEQKLELAKKATLVNMAYLNADFAIRQKYFEGGVNISVVHFKDFPGLVMRILPNSVVQFWKGNGFLHIKQSKIYPEIVSRADWKEIESKLVFEDINNEVVKRISSLKKLPVLVED